MVGVAQMVRAPDCDSGGRGFDSHHPPQFFRKRRKGAFCFSVYSAREKPEQCSGFFLALHLIGEGIFRQGNHEIVHFTIHAVPTGIKEDSGEILIDGCVRLQPVICRIIHPFW